MSNVIGEYTDSIDSALAVILLIQRIWESNADDEVKYDMIFGAWKYDLQPVIDRLHLNHEWYDPDTTYHEDTAAFVNSLVELETSLKALETSLF